jgi:hypothetical protein
MIAYPVSAGALRDLIAEEGDLDPKAKGWLSKAAAATKANIKAKAFIDSAAANWSAIKGVFMRLQHNKCAYCERVLAGEEFGRGEHDVEHFRPKGRVSAWPGNTRSGHLKDFNPAWPLGGESSGGYYKLAYDFRNYATACGRCNSGLKRDYFPVAGKRKVSGDDPEALASEKPLLVMPVGDWDTPPESLIWFDGVLPVAAVKTGYGYQRAATTIAFFRLDGDDLAIERARMLYSLHDALESEAGSANAHRKARAARAIAMATHPSTPHSNCAASYVRLYRDDYDHALEIQKRIESLLPQD